MQKQIISELLSPDFCTRERKPNVPSIQRTPRTIFVSERPPCRVSGFSAPGTIAPNIRTVTVFSRAIARKLSSLFIFFYLFFFSIFYWHAKRALFAVAHYTSPTVSTLNALAPSFQLSDIGQRPLLQFAAKFQPVQPVKLAYGFDMAVALVESLKQIVIGTQHY